MKNLQDVYDSLQSLAGTSAESVEIKSAAVAILWRHAPKLQVYLVRRALSLRFLPGYWSFPGGKQEATDSGPSGAAKRELEEETAVSEPRSRLPQLTEFPKLNSLTRPIAPFASKSWCPW